MALSASFIWKNADSTKDLNARLRKIIKRGIVWGGDINPGSGLTVQVDPFVAVGFDGLTVGDTAPFVLTVAASVKNYIVVRARYNEGGMPAVPTLGWQVLPEAAYLADPEKDFLIVFGVVDLGAVTVVTTNDIYYGNYRDSVDPVGRSWYRGTVNSVALLPVPPPHVNWIGDFYWVQFPPGDNTLHFWNGTAWEPLNTGSYNSETNLMNKNLVESERDRIVNGSGVVAGPRPSTGDFAAQADLALYDGASAVDFELGVDSFSAVVNGHFVEAYARNVTLSTPPVAPYRYDLIFLEVWREDITIPETQTYARNPDGSTTYTIDEVDTQVEEALWKSGIASPGNSFDLNVVQADNHLWRVTKWRLGVVDDVPQDALVTPNIASVVTIATNIDGVNFSTPLAGAGADERVWIASSATTPADGKSWAIPLVVIKRISTEALPGDNIKIFRDGIRHVFPVYPDVDRDKVARTLPALQYDAGKVKNLLPYDKPSGFVGGINDVLETGVGGPFFSIRLTKSQMQFRIRGFEDSLQFPFGRDFVLSSPPTSGWTRTLVYLRMNITAYNNTSSVGVNENYAVSEVHRPYMPMPGTGATGWKRGYVSYEMVYEDIHADVLDEFDAMSASVGGWRKGDQSVLSSERYNDGGLWSRHITVLGDDLVHMLGYEWAIPVCLVHRRNRATWAFDTNPNGDSATRPDGRGDSAKVYADDLVDLRHRVDMTEADCEALMKESIDKMMKGDLRTRMANKYLGAGTGGVVAGSRILQTDYIGNSVGGYDLTAPDGYRTTWSDAKEFAVVSIEVDITAASSSSSIHTWALSAGVGTLVIQAPAGATIVRHIPGALHAVGDMASADHLDFYGPPCWSTQWDDLTSVFSTSILAHACALTYNSATHATGVLRFWNYNYPGSSSADMYAQPFKVDSGSVDASGRATKMTGYVDTASTIGDTALISFWVHYDRNLIGINANNYGLAEIPDTVHKAVLNPSGVAEELHIGPIYAVVDVTVSGATTAVITSADVTAATGTPGTVILWGIDVDNIKSDPDVQPQVSWNRPYSLSSGAQDTITIYFTSAYTGTLRVTVFYESDIEKWIEVGRGGKSVQGIFSWGKQAGINLGSPPTVTDYTIGLGKSTWVRPTVGKDTSTAFPLLYTRTGTSGDWYLAHGTYGLVALIRHAYSNALTLKSPMLSGLDQYVYVVWPNLQPLTTSDKVQIDYTYTPYQGLSASGGTVANTAIAVPKLKKMLHGKIEGNTDFYVTQSGTTSRYSGVNTFTGKPVNGMVRFDGSVHSTDARMSTYNKTMLIAPSSPYGTEDPLAVSEREKYTVNAAAVLRLPFPINPAMISPTYAPYHAGVMDFDLDPVRAGAAAGFRQYAPGYPNSGYATTISAKYRGDHFINGLSRLKVNGAVSKVSSNTMLTAERYSPLGASPPVLVRNCWSSSSNGDVVDVQGSIDTASLFETIPRILSPYASDSSVGYFDTSGSFLYEPYTNTVLGEGSTDPSRYVLATDYFATSENCVEWTSIEPFSNGTEKDYILCTTPAVVTEHLSNNFTEQQLSVVHRLQTNPGATIRAKVYASQFTVDTIGTRGHLSVPVKLSIDLVVVPFDSGQRNEFKGGLLHSAQEEITGSTTLRGKSVAYPEEWSPTTVSDLENLFVGSDNGKGSGRGIYLGTTTQRFNMPMFVPGTGTSLETITTSEHILLDTPTAPTTYPVIPTRALFDRTNITYVSSDIGGPIAYVCYGTIIRPDDNDYKNNVVLQVAGGPTGGVDIDATTVQKRHSSQALDGQAIDAFWMPGRPILKAK